MPLRRGATRRSPLSSNGAGPGEEGLLLPRRLGELAGRDEDAESPAVVAAHPRLAGARAAAGGVEALRAADPEDPLPHRDDGPELLGEHQALEDPGGGAGKAAQEGSGGGLEGQRARCSESHSVPQCYTENISPCHGGMQEELNAREGLFSNLSLLLAFYPVGAPDQAR
jgi:hypothetical protein